MENVMFDKKFVTSVLSDVQVLYDVFPAECTFSIDTRTLQKGNVFIAFKGQQVDGHDYIADALKKGAAGLIINKEMQGVLTSIDAEILKSKMILLVSNTYQALYKLAAKWRLQYKIPVVGITGSVGKTSTREIVTHILSLKGKRVVATGGNYSSLIGLSLSLLKMRDHHEIGVFEVGISQRGDMSRAVDILKPTIAAITMIGHSHMEGLGSFQDIAIEKRLVFKGFKADSVGIINGDQGVLARVGYSHPVLRFGFKSTNQIQARKVRVVGDRMNFILKLYKEKYAIKLRGCNEGRIVNSLAAASICHRLRIEDKIIIEGIQSAQPFKSRFEFLPFKTGKGWLIDDCYNASPESVKAALLGLEQIKSNAQKVAVLGDMLELGVDSSFWHRQIGRFLRKTSSIKKVFLVGKWIKDAQALIPESISVVHVEKAEEVLPLLKQFSQNELFLLVKGSRGMHLNVIVDALSERPFSFAAATKDSEVMVDEKFSDKQISM
jgi:UDP-N-acetylmuramoyl-tripeptide--D-alanyl-D-alanine ligase